MYASNFASFGLKASGLVICLLVTSDCNGRFNGPQKPLSQRGTTTTSNTGNTSTGNTGTPPAGLDAKPADLPEEVYDVIKNFGRDNNIAQKNSILQAVTKVITDMNEEDISLDSEKLKEIFQNLPELSGLQEQIADLFIEEKPLDSFGDEIIPEDVYKIIQNYRYIYAYKIQRNRILRYLKHNLSFNGYDNKSLLESHLKTAIALAPEFAGLDAAILKLKFMLKPEKMLDEFFEVIRLFKGEDNFINEKINILKPIVSISNMGLSKLELDKINNTISSNAGSNNLNGLAEELVKLYEIALKPNNMEDKIYLKIREHLGPEYGILYKNRVIKAWGSSSVSKRGFLDSVFANTELVFDEAFKKEIAKLMVPADRPFDINEADLSAYQGVYDAIYSAKNIAKYTNQNLNLIAMGVAKIMKKDYAEVNQADKKTNRDKDLRAIIKANVGNDNDFETELLGAVEVANPFDSGSTKYVMPANWYTEMDPAVHGPTDNPKVKPNAVWHTPYLKIDWANGQVPPKLSESLACLALKNAGYSAKDLLILFHPDQSCSVSRIKSGVELKGTSENYCKITNVARYKFSNDVCKQKLGILK